MRSFSILVLVLAALAPRAQAQQAFADTLVWELVGPSVPLYPDSTADTQGLAFVQDTLVASASWLGGSGLGNVGGELLYFDEAAGEWRGFRVNTGTFGGRDGLLHAVTLTGEEAAAEPGAAPGSQALFLDSRLRAGPADFNWTRTFLGGTETPPTRGPGGALYLGTNYYGNGDSSLVRSRDGGRSWAPITGYTGVYPQALAYAAAVPTPPAGGLPEGASVSGDAFGMAYSHRAAGADSLVWQSVASFPGQTIDVVAVQAGPRDGSKAGRFLATVYNGGINQVQVYASDDGGATWAPVVTAPTPGAFYYLLAAPDGAVYFYYRTSDLGRSLYGSGDGGQTWADLGPVGGAWPFGIRQIAVGPDGRLYAGGSGDSPWGEPGGGVFRTTMPVVVAADDAPPSASAPRLRVRVYPNPSGGAVTLALAGLAPHRVVRLALYDVLGREVAVLHDGPARAEQRFAVEPGTLAAGSYVARAESGGQVATATFTVAE